MGKNYTKLINEQNLKIKKIEEMIASKEYSGDTVIGDVQTLIGAIRLGQEVLQMMQRNIQQQMQQVQPTMVENSRKDRFHQERGLVEDYAGWREVDIKKEDEARAKVNAEAEKRMKEKAAAEGTPAEGESDGKHTAPTESDSTGDEPEDEGSGEGEDS